MRSKKRSENLNAFIALIIIPAVSQGFVFRKTIKRRSSLKALALLVHVFAAVFEEGNAVYAVNSLEAG